MCDRCDYGTLLRDRDLDRTLNRVRILEIIGNSSRPLSAHEIFAKAKRGENINRVTVYRILDLLVENRLVERISAGDRSFRYGLAPNANHGRHAHFYCTGCGRMECLSPGSPVVDMASLESTIPGTIERVEVRLDGICETCLDQAK
ncbi:MAG TPA: Fur family transcriptional regulator [Syntrophobacteria bacterium]|nr:Fur family transcriptional regulator [Syntrophobacteria bacterium]